MRYVLALDLKNDPVLITEYERYHEAVWPEVLQSMRDAGITNMEIYRVENRLVLLMDTAEDFSLERKADIDAANPTVQAWETLMWRYQQALPSAQPGQKWVIMEKIFQL
ncbi:MAG TPA: L-rhamnose mutarotase [Spirosoma sp.]|nr:L-rhamnose mutarotase [Spirosoma sp.]